MTEWPEGDRRAPSPVSGPCEDMREHVDPYALGVLDEAEARAVEGHLAACPLCRARLAETEGAIAAIPHALAHASRHRPPPALRERVMASVLEDSARPRAAPSSAPADRVSEGARLPWISRPAWRTLGGVAAAAVLALSLTWTAQLGVALARERALREGLVQELAAVSGQREIVLEVVDARDKTTRLLRPVAGAPREFITAYGKVYTRPDMPHVVAMTGRMPPPPPGQVYHLWLRLDGETRFGGVLEINTDGFGQLVFQADGNGPRYESVWLTLQPPAPPGQPSAPQGATVLRWDPN